MIFTNKGKLFLFEREVTNYSINQKSLTELKKKVISCTGLKLDCIIKNEKLFEISQHKIERISNGKFKINQIDENSNLIVLPFVWDNNWKSINSKLVNVNDILILLKNKNSKDGKITIFYNDNLRFYLKLSSFLLFIFLFLYIFISSINKTYNFKNN